jgi:hypothetical protein
LNDLPVGVVFYFFVRVGYHTSVFMLNGDMLRSAFDKSSLPIS